MSGALPSYVGDQFGEDWWKIVTCELVLATDKRQTQAQTQLINVNVCMISYYVKCY